MAETTPQEVLEGQPVVASANGVSPREQFENAWQAMPAELGQELLSNIMTSSPAFFEQLVIVPTPELCAPPLADRLKRLLPAAPRR